MPSDTKKTPVVCAWSGGKDSTLMLQALLQSQEFRPATLLTVMTEPFSRISMHGVRQELLHAQAESLGIPVKEVWIPYPCPNGVYEERMQAACEELKKDGLTTFAFGDLYLEDVRAYRVANMQKLGLTSIFPLWGLDTPTLAKRFIADGFRARLCCVDTKQIPGELAGREYNAGLLAELPASADPCGENGEFHTFVFDGPVFRRPVPCVTGEVVLRDGFAYCDLLPGENTDITLTRNCA